MLRKEILKKLEGYIQASFSVPMTSATMSLISWVHKGADVKKIDYIENSVKMIFEANPEFVEKAEKTRGRTQRKIRNQPQPTVKRENENATQKSSF